MGVLRQMRPMRTLRCHDLRTNASALVLPIKTQKSESEKKYIENDVLVLKEALEMMFNEKHDKLTIGSCCLSEFKGFYDEIFNSMYLSF